MVPGQWSGGKGSAQRKVDKQKFSDNWDLIFSKNKVINSTSNNEDVLNDSSKEEKTENKTNS
jgi:hypothetical protein